MYTHLQIRMGIASAYRHRDSDRERVEESNVEDSSRVLGGDWVREDAVEEGKEL